MEFTQGSIFFFDKFLMLFVAICDVKVTVYNTIWNVNHLNAGGHSYAVTFLFSYQWFFTQSCDCLEFCSCVIKTHNILLNLAGAAQWDSGSAQWPGRLVWAGLGWSKPCPGQTTSSQGEADRHVPLSLRLLDHTGQHTEAAVHTDRGMQWYQGW